MTSNRYKANEINTTETAPDDKMARAAAVAEARITGQDTPSFDPRKKADRENQGWLTGDQFTIRDTPTDHLESLMDIKK